MKVRDLIALLATADLDREVILQDDAEGNSYSPLGGGYNGAYAEHEVGLDKLTPQDVEDGYSEDDLLPHGVPALILFPN